MTLDNIGISDIEHSKINQRTRTKTLKFGNFGIRSRLFASFGTLIALMAGVGVAEWQGAAHFAGDARELHNNGLKGAVDLANAENGLWQLRFGDAQYLAVPALRQQIVEAIPKWTKQVNDSTQAYSTTNLTADEQKVYNDFQDSFSRYTNARKQWLALENAGKVQEAAAFRKAFQTPTANTAADALSKLVDIQRQNGEAKYKNVLENEKNFIILLLSLILLAIALSVLLTVIVSRGVTGSVLKSVNQITSSSNKIASTVSQQEQIVSEQADSVSQTTTTIEELGSISLQSAQQAEAAATGARQVLVLAENGTKVVQQTMEGMSTLKDKVRSIAEQIIGLSEQTSQIAGISELVGDIANRTNILALNAAVEAARAGEQGRGFAVVATEIRKLADESKKSAGKINTLVTDIQAAMNSAVMVTDEGTKTADKSIELAQGTAENFVSVADAVNNVFDNSQKISRSAKQQAVAVQQVVAAINAINLGAQETTTGINQVKGSTEELNEAAHNLQALV